MALQATRDESATLIDVVEKILDKGLVINADICVSVAGVELLGIKIRAALASFETAAKYGLEFPSGTNLNTAVWERVKEDSEVCPQCQKKVPYTELLENGCPWCGWISTKAMKGRPEYKKMLDYR